jgi:hypothetical protein
VRAACTPQSASPRDVAAAAAAKPWTQPLYTPCSAVSRWWRIALAPGFAGPLCCIASIQHASGLRVSVSLSLSNTVRCAHRCQNSCSPAAAIT